MNRAKPFFYSLAIHTLLIALGAGAYNIMRIPEEEKITIPLTLLTYTEAIPSVSYEPPKAAPPLPAMPLTPPAAKPIAKAPISKATIPIEPIVAAAAKPAPPAPEPLPVPVVHKAPQQEPRVIPPAPPPPNAQANYEEENLARIRTILAERLTYPKNALRLRQQGEVIVSFMLSPEKEITGLTIAKSSEFELLDDAARRLIETSASEFPKPAKTVKITVPIGYKIR